MYPGSSNWYVVYTRANKEKAAADTLIKRGVYCYAPLLYKSRKQDPKETKPAFTRYIFAHANLEKDYRTIRRTDGVSHLIGFGGEPAVIEPGIIYDLRELEDAHGIIKLEKEKRREYEQLSKGDLVRVEWGPFAGLVGVVELLLGADKVRLLAFERTLTLPRADVISYSYDTALYGE